MLLTYSPNVLKRITFFRDLGFDRTRSYVAFGERARGKIRAAQDTKVTYALGITPTKN